MSNFTLYKRFNRYHMTDRHLHILDMMLQGKTQKELLDYLNPDRDTKYEGVSRLEDMLREISFTFGAPCKISGYKKNKEVIEQNKRIYLDCELQKTKNNKRRDELKKQIDLIEKNEEALINNKISEFEDIAFN